MSAENCTIKVVCPEEKTFWGWDAFNFTCATDELYCNGELVESVDNVTSWKDCEVHESVCKHVNSDCTELIVSAWVTLLIAHP